MNIDTRFTGLGVALPTPFAADGSIDLPAFRRVVRHVVSGGADFVVALGSTGEAATVEDAERRALIEAAREAAPRVPLVVGTGHNSTAKAARLAEEAALAGADALLVVTPYYNKPQPEGILAHFRSVAEAARGVPIIAYNVPGRTGSNLLPRDLLPLWEIPTLIGIKESSGNLAQIGEIARTIPEGRILLSGDDALALPAIALGAEGLISVAGNAFPAEMKALVDFARAGRRKEAMEAHAALLPFMDAIFLESNPAPIKAALEILGLCASTTRLPLMPASERTRERLAALCRESPMAAAKAACPARGVA